MSRPRWRGRISRPRIRSGAFALACVISGAGLSSCVISPPQIVAISPDRGSTGVAADQPVVVHFDRPVDENSVASRFSIAPALPGCALPRAFQTEGGLCFVVWSPNHDAFVFYHPASLFAPSATYRLSLGAGFRDAAGGSNQLDHHWDIATAPSPQVTAAAPQDATQVPLDVTPTFSFSRMMNGAEVAAATSIDPPVDDTVVRQSPDDPHRFILQPGRLLSPMTRYTVSISTRAADLSGVTLDAPAAFSFTTGTEMGSGHVAVLAARAGEPATAVFLAADQPWFSPSGTPLVWEAQRCQSNCPGSSAGPLGQVSGAVISPDSRWLAIVGSDTLSAQRWLRVIDLGAESVRMLPLAASLPSWSPDSRFLAFALGDSVAIYTPASGALTVIARDAPLAQAPWWLDSNQLLLPLAAADGVSLRLASRSAEATYLPEGELGVATFNFVATAGTEVAVGSSPGELVWLYDLTSGSPQLVAHNAQPLGLSQNGALIYIDRRTGRPALLNPGGGEQTLAWPATVRHASGLELVPGSDALLYVGTDAAGVGQVYTSTIDGSHSQAVTAFFPGSWAAVAVHYSR